MLGVDNDDDSDSSIATQDTSTDSSEVHDHGLMASFSHRRQLSALGSGDRRASTQDLPRRGSQIHHVLHREEQRVSLRAFVRTMLQNQQIAASAAMKDFLTATPMQPSPDELLDMTRRKEMDEQRIEDGKRSYEVARRRAAELDVHHGKIQTRLASKATV